MPRLARSRTRSRARTALWIVACLVASSCGSGGGSTTPDLSSALPAEILATGANVGGFGRIGRGGAYLVGFDDVGRAVFAGFLDDGRSGLFRGDGTALSTLWNSGGAGLTIDPFTADVSPSGRIAAATADAKSIALFDEDGWSTVVAAGDDNGAGGVFCAFYDLFVDDAGDLAFGAYATTVDQPCRGTTDYSIYVAIGGAVTKVASAPPASEDDLAFVNVHGIAGDGTAIVSRHDDVDTVDIVAAGASQSRTLVARGDIAAAGMPLRNLFTASCNRAGEIGFAAVESDDQPNSPSYGAYRSESGGVVAIARPRDLLAPGLRFRSVVPGYAQRRSINDSGDVLARALFSDPGPDDFYLSEQVVILRHDGDLSTVVRDGEYRGGSLGTARPIGPDMLNNAGQVALQIHSIGGDHTDAVMRWENGDFTAIASSGDASPAGGSFLAYGIGDHGCIASDGSVAIPAYSPDGHEGVLCGDAAGWHKLVEVGDRDEQGHAIYTFDGSVQCAFTDDGVVFSSWGDVWRASSRGVKRIAGEGDAATDGDVLTARVDLLGTSDMGTVFLGGYSVPAETYGYFVLRGSELLHIALPTALKNGEHIEAAYGIGIAEGDELIFAAKVADGAGVQRPALLAWREPSLREIAHVFDGEDFPDLGPPLVKGRWALFSSYQPSSVTRIDLRSGAQQILAQTGAPLGSYRVAYATAVDLSSTGRALITFQQEPTAGFAVLRSAVVDADGDARILDGDAASIGLADNGALLRLGSNAVGAHRQSLTLSGGLQGSSCF